MQVKHEYDQNVHKIHFGQQVLDYMNISLYCNFYDFSTPKMIDDALTLVI